MSNYDSLKFDERDLGSSASPFVKTGLIFPWATATAPAGYLLCDGSVISRTTYADLFAVLGTTFGVGDGASTFGIPDLRGKQIVFDDAGSTYTLGSNAGAVSNNVQPTITKGGNINVSVNGNTGNFSLGNSHLPAHTHAMLGNKVNYDSGGSSNSNPGTSNFTSRNQVLHQETDDSEGDSPQPNHRLTSIVANNLNTNNSANDVNFATTGNAFNGNANAGGGHAHSIGVNGSANYSSFTLNASSESVDTLFASVVLNAIIKT